jgi:hypothetical protein
MSPKPLLWPACSQALACSFAALTIALSITLGMAVCSSSVWAQATASEAEWKETPAAAPPAFELKRLIPFEVTVGSALKWGIDPQTISIAADGTVRYVVVTQSPGGVVNAMYEAIRCSTEEFKTFARYNKDSGWTVAADPQWAIMRTAVNSRYAYTLARQGVCTGAAPASSVGDIVQSFKQPEAVR